MRKQFAFIKIGQDGLYMNQNYIDNVKNTKITPIININKEGKLKFKKQ